ncbi:hypothetical protein Bca52824_052250 [Brassica carinata]|uniref:non-specific serine/threonine protein kinase n=1 Tax=Brassica carinata TaxID=52824 RepID=A0A8X7R2W8_BRACI|nr:hypothetical protein Bca52824_052250 [Brassica carinata]
MSPPLLITFVVFSVASFRSCFSADQQYEMCLSPLRCGSEPSVLFPNITYPFWGSSIGKPSFCGQKEFELSCKDNQNLSLEIENFTFRVVAVKLENKTITVADESLFDGGCPQIFNFTGAMQFTFNHNTEAVDLFNCSSNNPVTTSSKISCQLSSKSPITYHVFGSTNPPQSCTMVGAIPMLASAKNVLHQSNDSDQALKMALEKGFELRYTIDDKTCRDCANSGGICSSEAGSGTFRCLCADGPHKSSCQDVQGPNYKVKIGIGTGAAVLGLVFAYVGWFYYNQRMKTSDDPRQQNLKALIPLKHYSYAQVKRITKSFTQVVGKGGFGTVYRGTLCDGRSVAVKILKDSKSNGEDFINEVASMSKTSHVNIVDLLGFCSEGSKRAIVYEYLENGSLDKFISNKTPVDIDWMTLYRIALGVARGLEYLHHGCKTRIVHFDIKPHNVLLDDNLCPKLSDFGLAKLCEKKESILSLLDTRGTIGVSHKSDVYSYGMLVLEMMGARNKERAGQNSESNASSMYFPEWIYKDLEKGDSGKHNRNVITSEEEEIAKKMTLVGLWCIQPSPSDRPLMNRVVEMMEGSVDSLEVPHRPVFQIPAAPFQETSTLSEDISSYKDVCSMDVA